MRLCDTMRQGRARWLTRLAFLTGVALSALPAQAKEDPVQISSFSGAYLAAHIAESDNDLDNAIAYYKQALAFAPNDQDLQQSLMLALDAQGRFEESLVYADKLKTILSDIVSGEINVVGDHIIALHAAFGANAGVAIKDRQGAGQVPGRFEHRRGATIGADPVQYE